ncbi:hypothetical protein LPJ59_004006 [Coemansia sp. RSA 2399]|nr:hypothetical protein LPJ59_004006 [Coemansia sp. RSA 2399]KAJ1902035.1 hypothetical protein LPJ81_003661 [Coemansia sp. IMI 209127]
MVASSKDAREEDDIGAANARNAASLMYSLPLAESKPRANTDHATVEGIYGNRSSSGSEILLEYATGADEAVDFSDNKDIITMLREIPLPFKELDWERQVHYYHVARTNDAYRKATKEVKLA